MQPQSDLFRHPTPEAIRLAARVRDGWFPGQHCADWLLPWLTARRERTVIWVRELGPDHCEARFSLASSDRLRAIPAQFGDSKESAALALAIEGDHP